MTRDEWRRVIRAEQHDLQAPSDERFWSAKLETASREELRAMQGRKLAQAVAWMYERSSLFRRKCQAIGLEPGDVGGVDDLAKLPITRKEEMSADLEAHPPWGTYQSLSEEEWLREGWQVFQTSGTTGTPRPFRYTHFDRELWSWNNARALYAGGVRRGRDVALLCFGYGPHVFLWGVHYALNLMGVPVVPGGVDTVTRAHMVDRYRVTVLAATPSYLLYLADVMRQRGLDPAASAVRLLVTGGEPLPPPTRARIAAEWGAEVREFYGCTEAAPSAGGYTCGAGQLHVMEDTHLVEAVEAGTLQPVAEGRPGLTVITNLFSDSSPQIRFLAGDYTTLAYEPCECGRAHVRLGGVSGRADDMLNVRGVTLFPSAVEDLVRGQPDLGTEFEIVLTRRNGLDEIELVVEAAPSVVPSEYEGLARRLADAFRGRLELRPSVTVLPPDTLPKTEFKAKRVRDQRT